MRNFRELPRKGQTAFLVVVLISIAVAITQIIRVETEHFQRWKGGGMGMFSDIYARSLIVTAETGGQSLNVIAPSLSRKVTRAAVYPSEKIIARLCLALRQGDYRVKETLENGALTRQLSLVPAADVLSSDTVENPQVDQFVVELWDYRFAQKSKAVKPVLLTRQSCARSGRE